MANPTGPVSQSANTASTPQTPPAGATSSNVASNASGNTSVNQAATTITNSQQGITNTASQVNLPEANNASTQDYLQRAASLGNNVQKVALVGRTGAGTSSLTSGLSQQGGAAAQATSMNAVIFTATPDMSESGSTILVDIGDIRAAASVVIYMGSPSREFSLSAKFVSRTTAEATQNFQYISWIKAWRMPVLKQGESFGAEPETLRLYGYGKVLRGIPVMLQSYNIEYSSDVDYIQDSAGNWLPIYQTVSLSLKEVRSVDDLASFDYASYKTGQLAGW
jgi:hypothetical protein